MRQLAWFLAGGLLAASVTSEATARTLASEALPPIVANVAEGICSDFAQSGWQPGPDLMAALTHRINGLFRRLEVTGADPALEVTHLSALLALVEEDASACIRRVQVHLASVVGAHVFPDQPLSTTISDILEEIDRAQRAAEAQARSLADPRASRIFAGPSQYPPAEFAAYAIIAFRSLATPEDSARHSLICDAFVSTLPDAASLMRRIGVPLSQQIVTVWPVDNEAVADKLNRGSEDPCAAAIQHYDLIGARKALSEAALVGVRFPGRGPYLVAWSPAGSKGQPDAVVLVADLSHAETALQAKVVFLDWIDDIEENPALWSNGWDLASLRVTIRNWVDQYGEEVLRLVGR